MSVRKKILFNEAKDVFPGLKKNAEQIGASLDVRIEFVGDDVYFSSTSDAKLNKATTLVLEFRKLVKKGCTITPKNVENAFIKTVK